jgi:hypothetical protein
MKTVHEFVLNSVAEVLIKRGHFVWHVYEVLK